MFRVFLAAVVAALAAPSAFTQTPALGKTVQVEFTGKEPGMQGVPRLDLTAYKVKVYEYAIEPGDRFRVEVESVGGVEMAFWVFAFKDSPEGFVLWEMMNDEQKAKVDWSISKPPPGKKVRIFIGCADVGKVNVRISKVGDKAADDPKDAKIKKLEDENAALKKKLDEMQKQLDEIKKLLEKKK